jgi:hypothetical protein
VDAQIEKLIAWWQTGDDLIGQAIFAENFYWRCCSRLASGHEWAGERSTPSQDLRVLSKFSSNKHGAVILEETDPLTLIYYRHALFVTFENGRIVELITTKERAERW